MINFKNYEINPTEKMINAGINAIWHENDPPPLLADIVRRVYIAMEESKTCFHKHGYEVDTDPSA